MSAGVVIAGGGLAAQRSAEALRRGGYEGRVRIVSNELHAPYDRPPLSKDFLSGEREIDDLLLRPADWHDANDVELVLGDAAAGLDVEGRRLLLESGRALDFEHLVIATGSRPRTLPGLRGLRRTSTRCAASTTRSRCARRCAPARGSPSSARADRPGGRGDGEQGRRRGDADRGRAAPARPRAAPRARAVDRRDAARGGRERPPRRHASSSSSATATRSRRSSSATARASSSTRCSCRSGSCRPPSGSAPTCTSSRGAPQHPRRRRRRRRQPLGAGDPLRARRRERDPRQGPAPHARDDLVERRPRRPHPGARRPGRTPASCRSTGTWTRAPSPPSRSATAPPSPRRPSPVRARCHGCASS